MTRLTYIPNRIIDHNGIADGATVHVYLTGTTTPVVLYSDSNLTVPTANPFTVAAGAAFPAIYYDSSVDVKLTIVSALDGSIEEYDPYRPFSVALNAPLVSVKTFGATGDGVTNDGAAFVTAIAYLKAQNLNSAGGAYKGSQMLFVPAGHYYMGTTTLDINHTVMIVGEGSGRMPAPAYGCTHLRWDDGACGIRIQFPTTSGTTTVDAGHDGAGSVYLKNFSMQGGYAGSTSNTSHAIVVRAITFLDDILIRQWGGTGVLAWTGTVLGTAYSGNTSVSRFTGVKVEACNIGFDTRGTDSNVITVTNCEAYQCRQAGFVDDNGAGSNTYIGCHATYNGASSTSVITQVTYSSKRYALKWGQESGAATNAPSGTTANNTWWYYVGTGSADAQHPAWTSGMSNLHAGGDYIMLSNYPTVLINCYVEGGGGFSQLNVGTLALGGTNLGLSSAGGTCLVPEYDGLALKRMYAGAQIHLDGSDGGTNGIDSRDSTGSIGSLSWTSSSATYIAGVGSGHRYYTLTAGTPTYRGSWMYYGIDIPTGEAYYINSLQVVGARGSAVTRISRTATAGTLPTPDGSITIANAATPTVSELLEYCTELEAKLEELTAKFRAATGHGLIA